MTEPRMTGTPWSSQDTQHCRFIITLNLRLLWVELFQMILPFKFSCECNSGMYEDPETDAEMLIHWGSPETDCHWSLDDGSRPMTAACADSEAGHGTSLETWRMQSQHVLKLYCNFTVLTVYWSSAGSFLHLCFEMSKNGLPSTIFFFSLKIWE